MNQIAPLLLRHVMSATVANPPAAERDDTADPDFLLTLGTIPAAVSGPDQASAEDEVPIPNLNPTEKTLNQRQICTVRTWRNTVDFDTLPLPDSTALPGPPFDPAHPNSDAVPPAHAEIPDSPQAVPPPNADRSLSRSGAITRTREATDPDSASEELASLVAMAAQFPAPAAQATRLAGGNAMVGAGPSITKAAGDVPVSTPDDAPARKAMPSPTVAKAAPGPSTFSAPRVHLARMGEGTENTVTDTEAEPGVRIRSMSAGEMQRSGSSPSPMIWPVMSSPPAAPSDPAPISGEIQTFPVTLPQSAPRPGTTTDDSMYPQLPNRPAQAQDAARQVPATDDGGAEVAAMERGFPHLQGGLRVAAETRNEVSRAATDPAGVSPAPPPTAQSRNADSGLQGGAVTPEDALAPLPLAHLPAPARPADPAVSATVFNSSDNRSEGVSGILAIHSSEMAEGRKLPAAAMPARVAEAPISAENPTDSDGPEETSGQMQKPTLAPTRLPMTPTPALPAESASQPLGRSPAENVLRAIDAMMPETARSKPTPLSISSGTSGSAEAAPPADPRSAPPPGRSMTTAPAMDGSPADHSMVDAEPILDFRSDAAPAGPERAPRAETATTEAFASRPMPRDPVEQIRPILSQLNTGTTEILLSPEELGPLRVEVSTEGDKLTVVLSAERSETLELVRRNLDRLLSDLRNAGFSQVDLGFGRWSGGNAQEHAPSSGTVAQLAQDIEGDPAATLASVNPIQRPDGGLYLRI